MGLKIKSTDRNGNEGFRRIRIVKSIFIKETEHESSRRCGIVVCVHAQNRENLYARMINLTSLSEL